MQSPVYKPKAAAFAAKVMIRVGVIFLILLVQRLAVGQSITTEQRGFFGKHVQPVLSEHCYKCHSAKAEKVKGGFLMDSREALLKGGDSGPALVPGEPDKSRLIIAIRHTDADLQMPPKEKLSDEQISRLEEWVRMGAPDPRTTFVAEAKASVELWSAKPIQEAPVPKVKATAWVKDPIDAFILADLEKHNLSPARPAEKRDLIRRATFDLIGLPPTPDEVDAFLADSSPEAFAKVVDRLLDSPHFGERWGRHWLDVARYAESNGLDFNDLFDNAWRYRDYVIKAFNSDKPYDDFIQEQLAGDLLPAKDLADQHENWIATGFLMLGPKNFNEPNRQKLLMDVADEQIDVTSRAFLGVTVSCARCHDHKSDPIPTRDYYALAGIFRSTATLIEGAPRGAPNVNPFSQRPLGTAEETAVVEEYNEKLGKLTSDVTKVRQMRQTLPGGIDSKMLDGIVVDNVDAEMIGEWKLSNYSTNFVDKNYLQDGNERPGKGKKSVRFKPAIPQDGLYEIRLAYTARFNRATNVPVLVQGKTEKTIYLNQTVEPKYDKAFETLGIFDLSAGTNTIVEVRTDGTKGFVVVDAVQLLPQDVDLAARLRRMPMNRPPEMMMVPTEELREDLEYRLAELRASAPPPVPMAMAVRDGPVRNAAINIRGDVEKLGDEVPRGFLTVVTAKKAAPPETSSGRLELAQWITSPDNPLTARVMVNRIWLHLFGKGLVATPDNFGIMGEPPTHPELLDYLASEFMAEGWSTKKLIRRIMLSSAYQMSAGASAVAQASDPENNRIWRMNRKRLEAEAVRDAMLVLNGSLDRTIGGNAVPEQLPVTNPPNAMAASLESKRRSIYLRLLRNNVPDFLQVLDFPDPHVLSGKRHVTTAPTQALLFMNSPYVIEQARRWSDRLLAGGAGDSELIERTYLAAFARPCSPPEKEKALQFLRNFTTSLAQVEPDQEKRRARAWQSFCHAIIQSTEFRFIN